MVTEIVDALIKTIQKILRGEEGLENCQTDMFIQKGWETKSRPVSLIFNVGKILGSFIEEAFTEHLESHTDVMNRFYFYRRP